MLEIRRHAVIRNALNEITGFLIGAVYKNPITGKESYAERKFTIGGANADFSAIPTLADARAKIKEWLTTAPQGGKPILQDMKDETVLKETIIVLKQGDANSLVGEAVSEG